MKQHHVTQNPRQSGIETLRLLSMVFILALHVNYFAFGAPLATDFQDSPLESFLRVFLESLTIVGVNTFVLISGWFGIHPKARSVCSLLFQCAFFCCVLYAAGWAFGVDFSRREALKNLFFLGKLNWFIKSYLLLYILSPVLEAFVTAAGKRLFGMVVAFFFAFQSLYGWLYPVATFFDNGYSTISFVGLYLLARYVRLFRPRFATLPPIGDLSAYLAISAITTGLGVLAVFGATPQRLAAHSYCSPFVVAAALFLFLFFSKQRFTSRFVNGIAHSSYAIYLFHVHPCVLRVLLISTVSNILSLPAPAYAVLIPLLLVSFAASAVALDRIRILLWNSARAFFDLRKRAP